MRQDDFEVYCIWMAHSLREQIERYGLENEVKRVLRFLKRHKKQYLVRDDTRKYREMG